MPTLVSSAGTSKTRVPLKVSPTARSTSSGSVSYTHLVYETCLEIINLRQYPDPIDGFDYRGAEYPLRISAFAKGLRYYRNERAWRKAETRLAKEAMIPDECLKQRREKDPDPVCFLSGIVGEAERIPRDLSPGDRGGSDDAAVLLDRKSTRLNSSHSDRSRMPSSA